MRARFSIVALIAASLVAAFAGSGASPAQPSPTASKDPTPARVTVASAVRVGHLLYRIDAIVTTRVLDIDDELPRENAPPGLVYVIARLSRSNATQTFAPVSESGLRLRARDGECYSPSRVARSWCHGAGECAVLDPGEARGDLLVWRVPESVIGTARIEIDAPAREPGPRAAIIDVACAPAS